MNNFFDDSPKPFMEHFTEFRVRLLRTLAVVGAFAMVLMVLPSFKNSFAIMIFKTFQRDFLPKGINNLIFIDSLEPIFVIMKIAFLGSIFCTSPYILFEFIGFVGPGLLKKELKSVLGIIFFGTLLLFIGLAISYIFIIPVTFDVLIRYGTMIGGMAQITFDRFYSITLMMFFTFAFPFELPVILFFLAKTGIVTTKMLKEKRKYIYLSFFVVGAIVTPDPTPFSQTLLSFSMIILYEIGYFTCLMVEKNKKRDA